MKGAVFLWLKTKKSNGEGSISLGSWMLDFLQTYKAPKVRPKTLERYMHYTDQYYEKYYPFFLLAVTSGARLGELLGLSAKAISS